jgi:uncharacterized integral membrane protein (TIGR00697 family)
LSLPARDIFFSRSGRPATRFNKTGKNKDSCFMNNQTQLSFSPIRYRYLDMVMAFFAAILIISNAASSAKIVDLGFSLFGIRLSFDGGTILFPISYVFGDILTEVYGFKSARRVIWTGFSCLVLASLVFFILKWLPGESLWNEYAGDAAYDAILGGMSSFGLVAASLSGYCIGGLSNSLILTKMKTATQGKWLWTRTIGSTLIGELLDSLVFFTVACLAGVFQWEIFISLVLTNYLFKCSIEVLMTPLTYFGVAKLKKLEMIES